MVEDLLLTSRHEWLMHLPVESASFICRSVPDGLKGGTLVGRPLPVTLNLL